MATLIFVVLLVGSCSTLTVHRVRSGGPVIGPPAHAPAHGYRRKTLEGRELVYDAEYGLYVVVGMPHHYYWDGRFYRLCDSRWEVSLHIGSGWSVAAGEAVPPGLRSKAMPPGHQKKVARSKGRKARR